MSKQEKQTRDPERIPDIEIQDLATEILAQTRAQVTTIQIAIDMASEHGGGGPSAWVLSEALWGISRQINEARNLVLRMPG